MAGYERILLTGGAGFVGSHLAPMLADAYPRAKLVMMVRPGEAVADPRWTTEPADLTNASEVERCVATLRPDLVAHLAAQASPAVARGDREGTRAANVGGCGALARSLARHAPGATVLFASSASVYDWRSLGGAAATESAPLRPKAEGGATSDDPYADSKVEAEQVFIDELGAQAKLVIARPVNHSGAGQKDTNFPLARFAAEIAEIEAGRRSVLEHGNLGSERDYLDVRDVARAYVMLIDHALRSKERVSVFNIASGRPCTIGALLDRLTEMSSAKIERKSDTNFVGGGAIRVVCDASRLRAATGWAPQYSIDDMLKSLLAFWRAQINGAAR